jgi:NAD(P)-dependent dehydrogenase (short-subunit alcohol dehydrogenase family)
MKVAFITGGATGIGRATVDKFVREGIKVGLFDNNIKAGNAAIKEHGEDALLFTFGDVRKRQEVGEGVAQTVAKFGKLDIVFTCAGIHRSQTILDITEEQWDEVMDVNLKGTLFTLMEAIPKIVEGGGGSVVMMGSDQCLIGKTTSLAYGASKGAIGQMTKSLALDLASHKIRVNTVCPGTIRTPLSTDAVNRFSTMSGLSSDEIWKLEAARYPMKRIGRPEEVAELVYFLSSNDASFTTGSLYPIEGGLTAG